MKLRITYYFLFLFFIIGCTEEVFFDEIQIINNSEWSYEETISFDVSINDTVGIYNLELIIDHSTEYAYENIYMKVHTLFPTIDKKEEQITIDLANKSGVWNGKCNSSDCKLKVFLLDRFKFPEVGKYQFKFEQFTRDESLNGINAIQLKIKEND